MKVKTKRPDYTKPQAEVWLLKQPLNLLVNLSSEAEFDDLNDGGEWTPNS